MIISAKTKISELIKHNKETIEVIGSINKHFKKLKNPLLRKALASRVTLADAAKIGGVPVSVMIDKLKEIGFKTDDECGRGPVLPDEEYGLNKKEIHMSKKIIEELDVRPILEGGIDPFEVIMAKLKSMDKKHTLKIINTFEPIPLLNILKKKGYQYHTERPGPGEVHTYLEKTDDVPEETIKEAEPVINLTYDSVLEKYAGKMKEIDVRDLEMPMPMVTILEELEHLNPQTALFVHHKRLPQYLLPELKDRSYNWVSKELKEGDLKLIIFK